MLQPGPHRCALSCGEVPVHDHLKAVRVELRQHLVMGMTEDQHGELLAVIGMASQTNALLNALQLPVDPQFLVES